MSLAIEWIRTDDPVSGQFINNPLKLLQRVLLSDSLFCRFTNDDLFSVKK